MLLARRRRRRRRRCNVGPVLVVKSPPAGLEVGRLVALEAELHRQVALLRQHLQARGNPKCHTMNILGCCMTGKAILSVL
jgi:hypothetical protein